MILVEAPRNTPIDNTAPLRTMTPSATSERAPTKQSSSMMTGSACNGSSTPPMPTPPCTDAPACRFARRILTVVQVSTIVDLVDIGAKIDEADGISTTFFAMKAERRTIEPGTARKPAARKRFSPQPANFEGTLSHHEACPGPPSITSISLRRNESRTAFLSHWLTLQRPLSCRSATRASPLSINSSAESTASRTSPLVDVEMVSRASKAALTALSSADNDMKKAPHNVEFRRLFFESWAY